MTLCANRHEADDLYQDTWVKVIRSIDSFDVTKDFEPWLTRLCVNTYRDKLRRLSRNPFLNFSSNESKEAVFSTVPAPEQEDYSDLYEAIDRLPEKLRLAIILFYFEDMDISKTAETLGIPPGTVKSRLNKARKLLKEVLTDETDLRL
jgi:RNA polymerase sigma-70 factor (ECF subfamily)